MKHILSLVLVGVGYLLLEVAIQLVLELAAALGWTAVSTGGKTFPRSPVVLGLGWSVVGLVAGVITIVIIPDRITTPVPVLGISLVLAPILVGGSTYMVGRRWMERGADPPRVFTFSAGAAFAFAVALVRFVYFAFGSGS